MNKPNKLIEALFPWVRRKREREELEQKQKRYLKVFLDGEKMAAASRSMQLLGWSAAGASEAMRAFEQDAAQRIATYEAVKAGRNKARLRPASRRTYQRIR